MEFLDNFKAIDLSCIGRAIGKLSILPEKPLASHGDHLPSWIEPDDGFQPQLPFDREQE